MNQVTLKHYLAISEIYYLKPGFIFVVEGPFQIQTVLGSCVSVCLFDSRRKIGGMNHYLLPGINREERTPRFGYPAMQALLLNMVEMGAEKDSLSAQIFGGAAMKGNAGSKKVAQDNVAVAREFLGKAKIPIHSEDTGGYLGRKILYLTELNQALTYKLATVRRGDFFDYQDEERDNYGKFH